MYFSTTEVSGHFSSKSTILMFVFGKISFGINSESGIKTKDELLDLSKKTSIRTFLIGESLLKNLDKNSIFSVL